MDSVRVLQTRHVLVLFAERGLYTDREGVSQTSDELGLKTRGATGNAVPREWTFEEVDFMAEALAFKRTTMLTWPKAAAIIAGRAELPHPPNAALRARLDRLRAGHRRLSADVTASATTVAA